MAMNTADAVRNPRALEDAIHQLMVKDGFGYDECFDHMPAYSREIFGRVSRTGLMRIEAAINRLIARSLKGE